MLKIKKITKTNNVYDISVKNNQNFYANNILVHNCVEVVQPTQPINHIDDPNGEIGICILGAINMDETESNELSNVCYSLVRFLDNLIDYQEYFVKAAENFTKNRRSLGIGLTNFAGYLAGKKISYTSPEAIKELHNYAEQMQFYLLDASCELAIERGPCDKYNETTYSRGVLPIDRYNKNVDSLLTENVCDWELLREKIKQYGLRHSTLTAQMPVESSSVVQNATNALEPIRDLITYKKSKQGVLKQVCPHIKRSKYYVKAWEITNNQVINNLMSVVQKWFDMSISTNHYYNYNHYENNNIPLSVIIKDVVHAYKMGLKTIYYCNTPDGSAESESTSITNCESGACTL